MVCELYTDYKQISTDFIQIIQEIYTDFLKIVANQLIWVNLNKNIMQAFHLIFFANVRSANF